MTKKATPNSTQAKRARAKAAAAPSPTSAASPGAVETVDLTGAPEVQPADSFFDFSAHVFPPYRGEATHADTSRLLVPISALTLDETNARLHDEINIRQIRASLRRRGQQTPVKVDRTGRVLKGNGTTYAAYLEGWSYVWVSVSELEGDEATGYAIADNATGLSSKWDFQQLAGNIAAIKERTDGTDLAFTDDDFAFEASEMGPILAADWTPGEFTGEHNDDEHAPGEPGAGEDSETLPRQEPAPTNPSDLDADDRADNAKPIPVTPNMRVVIDQAIERVRLISGDLSISEGKCLELICYDYLAGAPSREQALGVYEGKLTDSLEPVGEQDEQHDVQLRDADADAAEGDAPR